jgi:hypothetical protein
METVTAAEVPGSVVRRNAHHRVVVNFSNEFKLFGELVTGGETDDAFFVSVDREIISRLDIEFQRTHIFLNLQGQQEPAPRPANPWRTEFAGPPSSTWGNVETFQPLKLSMNRHFTPGKELPQPVCCGCGVV